MRDLAPEIAYFTRKLQDQNQKSIRDTGAIPEAAISEVLKADPFNLSEADKRRIERQLEFTFSVTQNIGASITSEYSPWLAERSGKIDFYYWNRLNRFYLEGGSLPANVVAVLDQVTDQILDYCGNPADEGSWKRRGMVMGHVQSGKTTNYSALICKAADSGYKVIILLAGLTNSLRAQTQERIDETFIGRKSIFRAAIEQSMTLVQYGEGDRRFPAYGTSRDRDFNKQVSDYGVTLAALKEPIIFVTKKNKSTLENLRDWIEGQSIQAKINYPVLVIDDEADNASVNTAKDPKKTTAINSVMREILSKFSRSSYVGYTATPFANIFIDPDTEDMMRGDDLFPKHFIKALDPPSNYVGADRVFDPDGDLGRQMVRIVEDYRDVLPLAHKRDIGLEELPPSLLEAIRAFVLVRAIRQLRGDGDKHCSMMINVSRFNDVQERVLGLTYSYLEQMKASIRVNAGLGQLALSDPDIEELRSTFELEYSSCEFDFAEILTALPDGVRTIETRTVNMRGGKLDYSQNKNTGLHVIAIGGLALSRGLTLEGLSISYLLRNTGASDTLMQMARWFGYRTGFVDICRLYLSEGALDHYVYIAEAIEEFRGELKRMEIRNETPEQFGLKIRRSETGIRVTAANKMRSASRIQYAQNFSEKHVEGYALYNDAIINRKNREVVTNFLNSLRECAVLGSNVNDTLRRQHEQHLVWRNVNGKHVMHLLQEFEFPGLQPSLGRIDGRRSLFQDYCSDREETELKCWDVVLPLLAGRINEKIDSIKLDKTLPTRSRNKGTLAGANLELYKPMGDKNRVADPKDSQLLLTDEQLKKAEALKGSKAKRGDTAYCSVRQNPLLMVHSFSASTSNEAVQHKFGEELVVTLGFCMPTTKVEAVSREYEVNAVYRKQLESLLVETEDDEDDLESNAND